MTPPDYESAPQAAERLGVSRAWVAREAKAGRIPGMIRVGRAYAIPVTWTPEHTPRPGPKPAADPSPGALAQRRSRERRRKSAAG